MATNTYFEDKNWQHGRFKILKNGGTCGAHSKYCKVCQQAGISLPVFGQNWVNDLFKVVVTISNLFIMHSCGGGVQRKQSPENI